MRMQLNPDLARCATSKADPDIFFMDDKDEANYDAMKTEIARSICGQCPIQKQCLEFAIKEEMEGMWGGTTTSERRVAAHRKRTGFVPSDRKSNVDLTKLVQVNAARALETSVRDRDAIIKALETFTDLEPITIEIANLRVNNPGVPLSELATMAGITKDVFAGRLKRLIKRLEKVA
jgi:WhiB family redox-sensing transcriptional regulator